MSLDVSWYVEGRVIFARGTAAVEDMAQRNHLYLQMIEADGRPPKVHIVVDYTDARVTTRPVSIDRYVNAPQLVSDEIRARLLAHPLLGWTLTVGAPRSLKLAGHVLAVEGKYRRRDFDTLEDAFAFLQRVDTTLPDLRSSLAR